MKKASIEDRKLVGFYLTKGQAHNLKMSAYSQGMNVSDYLRCLLKDIIEEKVNT
jgi:hypothetical protein